MTYIGDIDDMAHGMTIPFQRTAQDVFEQISA